MPEGTGNDVLDLLLTSAVVVGAVVIVIGGVVRTSRWLSKMVGVWDYLAAEMKPNGGHSLRDAVNRIESTQAQQTTLQAQQSEALSTLTGEFAERGRMIEQLREQLAELRKEDE